MLLFTNITFRFHGLLVWVLGFEGKHARSSPSNFIKVAVTCLGSETHFYSGERSKTTHSSSAGRHCGNLRPWCGSAAACPWLGRNSDGISFWSQPPAYPTKAAGRSGVQMLIFGCHLL